MLQEIVFWIDQASMVVMALIFAAMAGFGIVLTVLMLAGVNLSTLGVG